LNGLETAAATRDTLRDAAGGSTISNANPRSVPRKKSIVSLRSVRHDHIAAANRVGADAHSADCE
jgi:hypothetical protein